jgi:WD repeat-containing protein 68
VPPNQVPPLTSFSWSDHSPNLLVTSSIDTTCTLWDIHTSTALTQLIAHDRAVHDVSFLPHSSDVFVSVGSDGSLRAFDLRALEHSTILYEDPKNRPLMRVEFGKKEQHYLGVFGMGDEAVQVLDMRSPGTAVVELVGHKKGRDGGVNAIAWGCEGRAGTGGGGWIASCGE